MKVKANCKINIGLDILRRRDDGYHDLESVMFPVRQLYDEITIEELCGAKSDVEFVQSGIVVDCPLEKNLCVKAFRLMQQHFDIPPVRITLDKRVPFGAGLGGGSSDATSVLLMLNDHFSLGVEQERLVELAALLGSDTPFFVHNEPQFCWSRGEKMQHVTLPLEGLWLAVVKPPISISTAEAYGGVVPAVPAIPLRERLMRPIEEWHDLVKNDFERHLFIRYPQLAELKEMLYRSGAIYASMSGSGAALFGLFEHCPTLDVDSSIFTHIEKI